MQGIATYVRGAVERTGSQGNDAALRVARVQGMKDPAVPASGIRGDSPDRTLRAAMASSASTPLLKNSATPARSYTKQGQQVETSRITHVVESSVPRERLEALDGVPREIIRTGDEVVCYLPGSLTVKIDKQPGRRPFPAILSEQLRTCLRTIRSGRARSNASGAIVARSRAGAERPDAIRSRLWADSIPACCSRRRPSMKEPDGGAVRHSRSSRSSATSVAIS